MKAVGSKPIYVNTNEKNKKFIKLFMTSCDFK